MDRELVQGRCGTWGLFVLLLPLLPFRFAGGFKCADAAAPHALFHTIAPPVLNNLNRFIECVTAGLLNLPLLLANDSEEAGDKADHKPCGLRGDNAIVEIAVRALPNRLHLCSGCVVHSAISLAVRREVPRPL